VAVHKVIAIFDSVDKISGTARGIGGSLQKLESIAIGAGLAIAGAFVAAGAAATAFTIDSIKVASEFQDQIAIMSVATKDFGVDMETLSETALAVGADTRLVGVSATGAADAITGLAKAGLSSTEVFGDLNAFLDEGAELGGALRASIDLAAASELDMVQASDLAAVALATFGGNLETAEERAQFVNDAMDNMVKAADASVAEVSDLAEAMKNIGPTAASFGFSLQDTNTALAILSTRGIAGAEAGTALKSMMTNLMRPTDNVKEVLRDLNVSLFDAEGNMKGLPTIIGDLQGSMSDLTQEQKLTNVQVLAGTFGMKAMATLLDEGVEGWKDMEGAIEGAAGIQENAAARTQTLSGRVEALQGVIETIQIMIGTAFLPVLSRFTDWAADMATNRGPELVAFFEEVAGWVEKLFDLFLMGLAGEPIPWGELFPPDVLATITKIAEGVKDFVSLVVENKDTIVAAFKAIGKAIATALFVKKVLGIVKVLMMLTNPLGWILLAVGLLAAAWKNNWGDIQGKVQAAWEFIQPILETLRAWLEEKVPMALEFLQEVFTTVFDALAPIVETVINELVEFWIENFTIITEWMNENWPLIQETVQRVMAFIQGVIQVALAAISAFWRDHGEEIMVVVGIVWEAIQNAVQLGIQIVLAVIETAMEIMNQDWDAAWQTVLSLVDTIWAAIKEGVVAGVIAVSTLFGIVKEVWPTVWDAIWTGIQEAVQTVMDALPGIIDTGMKAAKFLFGVILETMKIVAGNAWDKIVEMFNTGVADAKGALTSAVGAFKAAGGAIVEAIKQGISDAWGDLLDWFGGKLKGLTDKLPFSQPKDPSSPLRKLPQAGEGIVMNLLGGMERAMPALAAGLNEMLALPEQVLGGGFGGAVPVSVNGAGGRAGGRGDTTINNNYNLTYSAFQDEPGRDSAEQGMREIEVAARLRR
jgi:TP901 family phage tail tape measure protein